VVPEAVAALLSQNKLTGWQEYFCNVDCLVQKPTRIIPQIEYERCHTFGMQPLESILKLFGGGVVETSRHVYVPHTWFQHVSVGQRRLRDRIASNLHR